MRLSPFALIDDWRSPAPEAKRVAWLKRWGFAHRGLHSKGVPENSLPAFHAAIARGLGIECDIQRAGDGTAMVFHDWGLKRLTGGKGRVADRRGEELEQIALKGTDTRIPSLSRMLAEVGGKVPLLLEIKSRASLPVRALCLEVRRALEGYRGDVAVMSFDPRVSRWFAEKAPHVLRGLVVTEEGSGWLKGRIKRRSALWHARPDFLAYDVRDLPSGFAQSQRERGLPVLTWTVRSLELARVARRHADAPILEGEGLKALK